MLFNNSTKLAKKICNEEQIFLWKGEFRPFDCFVSITSCLNRLISVLINCKHVNNNYTLRVWSMIWAMQLEFQRRTKNKNVLFVISNKQLDRRRTFFYLCRCYNSCDSVAWSRARGLRPGRLDCAAEHGRRSSRSRPGDRTLPSSQLSCTVHGLQGTQGSCIHCKHHCNTLKTVNRFSL